MADDVPEITVEMAERRSVLGEATVGGAAAGAGLLAVAYLGLGSVAAVGYPYVFGAEPVLVQSLFHGLFAVVFGTTFGLLVNTRPLWQYGRGFLGPLVGAGFGAILWVVVTAGYGLLSLLGTGFGFEPVGLAVGAASHLAYGALVGSVMNFIGLVQA